MFWNKKDDNPEKTAKKTKPVSACPSCRGTGMERFHKKASMSGPEQWGKRNCSSCKGKGVK